jgi:hypothetical protein
MLVGHQSLMSSQAQAESASSVVKAIMVSRKRTFIYPSLAKIMVSRLLSCYTEKSQLLPDIAANQTLRLAR